MNTELDDKTHRVIINYLLQYNEQSRKLKQKVPKNMWKQITLKINKILEIKRKISSFPLANIERQQLRIYFEQILIFQLKPDKFNLTEDEFFTLVYPYVDTYKKLNVIFISNRSAIYNIDNESLEKLQKIVKYRLNRYEFNYDIWDVFDSFHRMGVRKIEINVENSLFGLNPEEKRRLLLDSKRQQKFARLARKIISEKYSNSSTIDFSNLMEGVQTSSVISDQLSDSDNLSLDDSSDIESIPNASHSLEPNNENIASIPLGSFDSLTAIKTTIPTNNGLTQTAEGGDGSLFNGIGLEQTDAMNNLLKIHENTNTFNLVEMDANTTPQLVPTITESNTIVLNSVEAEITPQLDVLSGCEETAPINNEIGSKCKGGAIEKHENHSNMSKDVMVFIPTSVLQPKEVSTATIDDAVLFCSNKSNSKDIISDLNRNSKEHINSQKVVGNHKSAPLVHWSLLFDF